MFKFPTSLVTENGRSTVSAFREGHDEPFYQANDAHPYWNEIVAGLQSGDPNVWNLFDVAAGMVNKFTQVTDRVSWNGHEVLWDGDPIHSALADQIHRSLIEGSTDDYAVLARFWEKLESNPDEHSRTQAYDWLAAHKFQISEDGDVIGYKYVNLLSDGTYTSVARSQAPGTASGYVNGKAIAPYSVIPQAVGDVVTMPRSEVEHDPSHACKRGLHVGTFNYVGGYTRSHVLVVHVNPRDIVSVPTDGNGGKVRVCRYTVAGVATQDERGTAPVVRSNTAWVPDVSYKG